MFPAYRKDSSPNESTKRPGLLFPILADTNDSDTSAQRETPNKPVYTSFRPVTIKSEEIEAAEKKVPGNQKKDKKRNEESENEQKKRHHKKKKKKKTKHRKKETCIGEFFNFI